MSEQNRSEFDATEAFNAEYADNLAKFEPAYLNIWIKAWNAATTEANKRIVELECEVAELENSLQKIVEVLAAGADLNESYRKTIDAYEKAHKAALEEKTQARHDEALAYKHYHELKASNHDLREALNFTINSLDGRGIPQNVDPANLTVQFYKCKDVIREALSATPAESLQAHDDDVISKERNEIIAILDYHGSMFADEVNECFIKPRGLKEVK